MVALILFLLFPSLLLLPNIFASREIPSSDLNFDHIYQIIETNYNKGMLNSPPNPENINQIYHILNNDKEKYESPSKPEDINRLYRLVNWDHVHDLDLNLTMYFQYNDTSVGKKMPLVFTNQGPLSAKLIKNKHPNLANPFSNSCGKPKVVGEQRLCVDSLESMMDFVAELMGRNVTPLSTPVGKWQYYTISGPVRTISHQVTGCHKKVYSPFAVYGCHYIPRSEVRIVPLVGTDGTKLEAVSVCHMDTSSWNAGHIVFLIMKIKPGPPICHFLATDDITWVTS